MGEGDSIFTHLTTRNGEKEPVNLKEALYLLSGGTLTLWGHPDKLL